MINNLYVIHCDYRMKNFYFYTKFYWYDIIYFVIADVLKDYIMEARAETYVKVGAK